MTINDRELCEWLVRIHQQDRLLEAMERNGQAAALWTALDEIEVAAREAKWRMNTMRYAKGATDA